MSSSTSPAAVRVLTMPELRSVSADQVTEQLLDRVSESARQAARAQGYAVGWAEGRRAGEADVTAELAAVHEQAAADAVRREAEHAAAVRALQQAAAQLAERTAEVCRAVDAQASTLALELTRELVGAPDDVEAAAHVVERVLGVLPDHPVVRVRLHPAVVAGAGALREREVAILPDPDLGPADAVVEADDHVVDLRVGTALARIAEALRGDQG